MKSRESLVAGSLLVQCVNSYTSCPSASQTQNPQAPRGIRESAAQQKTCKLTMDLLAQDCATDKADINGRQLWWLAPDMATKFWPIYSEYDAETDQT